MWEVVAVMTYLVEDIVESEFPDINNVVAFRGVCVPPIISMGEQKEMTPEEAADTVDIILNTMEERDIYVPDVRDVAFKPNLNSIVHSSCLRPTGTLYVKYDGLATNLKGLIRVTSHGRTGKVLFEDGRPLEFTNKVEKYVAGEWKEI